MIPPTTNGNIIKCSYEIEVVPRITGCCSKNSLCFTVGL